MKNIFHKLMEYCNEDFVPMHMPGHKRNIEEFVMGNPYGIDITEIDGFDNLHNPNGIIKDSMACTSHMYGSKNTFYLVNGSSAGLLTAISAVTKRGKNIIVARNCHKSVYNAIYLNDLYPVYVYPDSVSELGINNSISARNVEKLLKENKDVNAVIITSPTYEGVISDIKAIADIVHLYKIPLIVDEAHGAHFHFHEAFPDSALDMGADIVVQSIHKTLPAFTQTALLHVKGELVDVNKVKQYLDIYQSSSPSYILMAGIDNCMEFLRTKGPDKFSKYIMNLRELRNNINKLKHIKLFHTDDVSKLVLYVQNGYLNGKQLYDILLNKYHIQLEMASFHYVIAMTTVGDKIEYYDRFIEALIKIDNTLDLDININKYNCLDVENKMLNDNCLDTSKMMTNGNLIRRQQYQILGANVMESPYNALNATLVLVGLEKSVGKISGSAVCVYPPGIPVVNPGEMITLEIINYINEANNLGLQVIGLCEIEGELVGKNVEDDKENKNRGVAIQCLK